MYHVSTDFLNIFIQSLQVFAGPTGPYSSHPIFWIPDFGTYQTLPNRSIILAKNVYYFSQGS
jgi:hypothetical protein